MLVDSHCHLDFPEFADDLDGVVARAETAGVGTMVTICTHVTKFAQVQAVARRYPNIFCSVGIHPHEADSEPDTDAATLTALAGTDKVVGIGETGLDYYYDNAPRAAQRRAFRAHIAAARATGLPLIVHSRDADDDTIAILREEAEEGAFPGLIHCFTAGAELARVALDLGFYISLSGIVTFKNAGDLRETARQIPPDRLLVETDAPFLAPVPRRGKTNEPAYVAHTAAYLADMLDMEQAAFADLTTDNFFRLFSLARRPGRIAAG